MRVHVLYFAGAREAVGQASETIALEAGDTVSALREALRRRHPSLAATLAASRFAVGERFAPETQPLASGDEVAVIPPVSGG